MATRLSVNLNKIALLRNARGRDYPSVNNFAELALDNGANGITLHPRPDERHARYDDVYELKKLIERYPSAELNIEGNPKGRFLEVVKEVCPHQCTLVPDADNQITSDHGWSLTEPLPSLKDNIAMLKEKQIRVSLFMDPDIEDVQRVNEYKVDSIELYTEDYASLYERAYANNKTPSSAALNICLKMYHQCFVHAKKSGLLVNAGHDLNLQNLSLFLTTIDGIDEVSIGHALTVESLEQGFAKTIKQYVNIVAG